jgi:hypothetical protein
MSQFLSSLRWDMTWSSYLVWICVAIECNLAIICISVPVLRTLFRKYLPSLFPAGPEDKDPGLGGLGVAGVGKGLRAEKESGTSATRSERSRRGESADMRERSADGPQAELERGEAVAVRDRSIV